MLRSLKIKNFRSLEDFQVSKLGRVNLIVGKNNSGKSSVLEALRIYAGNANRELLENIAQCHDEKYYLTDEIQDTFESVLPFEDLFTGRRFPDDNRKIVIGDLEQTEKDLEISSVFLIEKEQTVVDETGEEGIRIRRIPVDKTSLSDIDEPVGEGLLITKENKFFLIDFDRNRTRFRSFITEVKNMPCSFIPTQFISMNNLAKDWDAIALTEGETIVRNALQIILPEFESLTFVVDDRLETLRTRREFRRLAKVKIKGLSRPVPLNSLGDGMLRVLQLVLKVFPAKGGFLLIDEFENGLHYSVQEKVWDLLFKLAEKLDIQIFATTHSWDCIESFSKVASANKATEGILFRVGQSVRTSDKGRVIATVFDEQQLYDITQSDVEVR
jgi:predicted ATPase